MKDKQFISFDYAIFNQGDLPKKMWINVAKFYIFSRNRQNNA